MKPFLRRSEALALFISSGIGEYTARRMLKSVRRACPVRRAYYLRADIVRVIDELKQEVPA
jgi:hypothetical protein